MEEGKPKRTLSVTDAIAVVVGIVIGAGIFATPRFVAMNVPSAGAYAMVWLAGGVVSLIGALCYAELATTYPDAGGEYHFLRRGLGSGTAFLFAWARLTVIQTGSIAIHAFIVGDYAADLLKARGWVSDGSGQAALVASVIAVTTVVVLTGLNLAGVRQGKTTQKLLSGCVVTAVLLVCVGGFLATPAEAAATPAPAAGDSGWWVGAAMVFVLLTYGGWNEAAYLSAEVRGGPRGIVKVLMGGIVLVTVVYLLINFAYLRGLGLSGIAGSEAVAADMLRRGPFGDAAATIVTVIILVAALGNMNATIMTGARTNYALGRDFPMFAPLGRWRSGREAPVTALLVQGAMTLALVAFGAWQRDGFKAMVEYTTPVFWLFFLLTGVSLIVLRLRDPAADRPFRAPLFPLVPLLFCGVCAYMLYSGIAYALENAGRGTLVGLAVLALGVPLMLVAKRGTRPEPRGFEPVLPTATENA